MVYGVKGGCILFPPERYANAVIERYFFDVFSNP